MADERPISNHQTGLHGPAQGGHFTPRVHVHPSLLLDGHEDRVDPDRWKPLIMSFRKFYGLSDGEVVPSRLAEIDEAAYRMPDVDRARRGRGHAAAA